VKRDASSNEYPEDCSAAYTGTHACPERFALLGADQRLLLLACRIGETVAKLLDITLTPSDDVFLAEILCRNWPNAIAHVGTPRPS
jgi:hypothetical protein